MTSPDTVYYINAIQRIRSKYSYMAGSSLTTLQVMTKSSL